MCSLAFLLAAPLAAQAFNPNEGSEPASGSKPSATRTRTATATAPTNSYVMPKINFAEPSQRQIPVENATAVATPASANTAPASAAPMAAMTPASAPAMEPIRLVPPPSPAYPPVDAATAARAEAELKAQGMPPATTQGYIAPAPLMATTGSPNAPEPLAEANALTAPLPPLPPMAEAPPPAPYLPLSDESKRIIGKIPSNMNQPKTKSAGKLAIKRTTPEIKSLAVDAAKVESFDSMGLSIKVRRPGLDTNYELNHAYTALMGGDTMQAIEIYKNILSTEPTNQDALFGLAATYHRAGDIEHARPYYGQLLKVNPNHREGLNNFLAMMSDESPQEALAELDRLEQRNPDFSPIPAQQALVLNKLGYADQAREKMLRAIELAPENMTYKYNLAVMLDKRGDYADAAPLYRLLIDAAMKGAKMPATVDTLQRRLNFIATATIPAIPVGG